MLRLAARQPWRVPLQTATVRFARTKAGSTPVSASEDIVAPVPTSEDQKAFESLQKRLNIEFAELSQLQAELDGSLTVSEAEAEQNVKKMSKEELGRIENRLGEKYWDEESLKILERDPDEFVRTFGLPGESALPPQHTAELEPAPKDKFAREAAQKKAFMQVLEKNLGGPDLSDLSGADPRDLFDDNVFNQNDPVQAFSREVREARALDPSADYTQQQEPWDPSHLRDPSKLPRRIENIEELGPNFTEAEYASALIHGRSVYPPFFHSRTSDIPAAVLHLRSSHPRMLDQFSHFALHAASSLAIPTSKTIMLPTQRSMWTVIRAPFVYKKSQENFERRVHKRCIKAWDADPAVVDVWMRFLKKHAMGGVGMRMVKWDRLPIGLDNAPKPQTTEKQLSKPPKANLRKSKAGPGVHIENLGKKIVADEQQATA